MKKIMQIKKMLLPLLLILFFSPRTMAQVEYDGDVNKDGVVNITDAIDLIGYLSTGTWPSQVHESGEIQTITVNGVSFNMVYVASGTFEMGAPPEAYYYVDNSRPVHQVTLSDYYIGQTEVTQELWTAVMGSNPSYYVESNQQPVHYITWADCQSFITKLNQLTGKNFRLPTEAEWEYAARGAEKTHGCEYAGGTQEELDSICWNSHNTGQDNFTYGAHPVAMKRPNEIGLYDMSGNVDELCYDFYEPYTEDPQVNPQGPETGTNHCSRGGCYSHNWWELRVFRRHQMSPTESKPWLGMRLAM
jgi:formylglycine-generating enzyme required for sulfatase activity